jgi:hypothetical protein
MYFIEYSQEHATRPYPEPDKSNAYRSIVFLTGFPTGTLSAALFSFMPATRTANSLYSQLPSRLLRPRREDTPTYLLPRRDPATGHLDTGLCVSCP